MKRLTITLIAATLSIGTAQAAVYKCEGPDGKLTFSDQPCQGEPSEEVTVDYIEPSESQRRQAAEVAARDSQMLAEQDRQNRIAATEERIRNLKESRDQELEALRNKKRYANNNLAGATWEQSISQEMDAVAQRYNADIQAAREELSELRAQGN